MWVLILVLSLMVWRGRERLHEWVLWGHCVHPIHQLQHFKRFEDVHWLRMMRHLRHWRHNHLRISRPIHLMLGLMIYHSRSHGRYRMQCIRHIECMLHFITIDKLIISDGF